MKTYKMATIDDITDLVNQSNMKVTDCWATLVIEDGDRLTEVRITESAISVQGHGVVATNVDTPEEQLTAIKKAIESWLHMISDSQIIEIAQELGIERADNDDYGLVFLIHNGRTLEIYNDDEVIKVNDVIKIIKGASLDEQERIIREEVKKFYELV